jgi:four helix bundle protein
MGAEGLERLDVWRKAKDFVVVIYHEVIPALPQEEKWGLGQQIRRAATSIPANLAEGYGRYYYQENIRFCYIARGSLQETLSHLTIAHELGYISDATFEQLCLQANDLTRLINGYIAYLKRSRQGSDEPGNPSTLHESSDILYGAGDTPNDSPLSTL